MATTKKEPKKKTEVKKTPAAKKAPAAEKAPVAKKTVTATAGPMTKNQIIAHFSEKFELAKTTMTSLLEELVNLSASEAKRAGAFTIPGLGKLSLINRKARMGRNPGTGEAIKIAAKTVVKMRLSKSFAETVVPPKKDTKKK